MRRQIKFSVNSTLSPITLRRTWLHATPDNQNNLQTRSEKKKHRPPTKKKQTNLTHVMAVIIFDARLPDNNNTTVEKVTLQPADRENCEETRISRENFPNLARFTAARQPARYRARIPRAAKLSQLCGLLACFVWFELNYVCVYVEEILGC